MGEQVTLARKSYEHLLRTRDRALLRAECAREEAEHAREWARRECDEQRRLEARLVRVVAAAASLGVSIQAINEALAEVTPPAADPAATPEGGQP